MTYPYTDSGATSHTGPQRPDRALSFDEWFEAIRDHDERARLLTEVDALIESISTEREPTTIAGDWVPCWARALRIAAELADKAEVYALTCQAQRRLLAEHGVEPVALTLAEMDLKL